MDENLYVVRVRRPHAASVDVEDVLQEVKDIVVVVSRTHPFARIEIQPDHVELVRRVLEEHHCIVEKAIRYSPQEGRLATG